MKPTRYYRNGTLLGLAMMPVVSFFLIGRGAWVFLLSPLFLGPELAGAALAYSLARLIDETRPPRPESLAATLLLLEGIFISGALTGSLVNLFWNGRPFGGSLADEVLTWVYKPAFWVLLYGVPCAAGVALAWYVLSKALRRR